MNTLRTHRHSELLGAACLLAFALALAGPAAAAPHAFQYWQGPDEMIIPTWGFRQFHSTLTNTGDQPDSYTMIVTRQQPANWYFFVTYGGVTWPDENQTHFQIPEAGTLAPGQAVAIEFEVMSDDEGTATYTVQVFSNSDPSVPRIMIYSARTPTEPYDLLFSSGETLIVADINQFVQFKPMFYNAGTQEDTYHLTMTRDLPPHWSASFCMYDVCFGDADESPIPPFGGTVSGGDVVPMDIDFLTTMDDGTGSVTITIVSTTNSTLVAEATFTVTTNPTSARDVPAILLSGVQAVPNPFNPRTEIRFAIGGERSRDVVIDLFETTGRLVRRLHAGLLQPGSHAIAWDGNTRSGQAAAAGVYMARVRIGPETRTVKLALVK